MKYIVGISQLKDVGQDIVDYSTNNLKENIQLLNKQKRELKWDSPNSVDFMEMYDTAMDRLFTMEKAIEEYGHFMIYCSEHYHDTTSELAKGWQEYLKELEEKADKDKLERNLRNIKEV